MTPTTRLRFRPPWRNVLIGSVVIALSVAVLVGLLSSSGVGATAREQVSDTAAVPVEADARVVVVALDPGFFRLLRGGQWGVVSVANALGYELGGLTRTYLVRDEVMDILNPGMAGPEFDDLASKVFSGYGRAVVGRTRVVLLRGDRDDGAPQVIGDETTAALRSEVEAVAFDSTAPTGDAGVVRTAALVGRPQGDPTRLLPSTALLGLIRADGLPSAIDLHDGRLVVGDRSIPVDDDQRARISFSDDLLPGGAAIVPAKDVIEGRADRSLFVGATVLVGVTDPNRARMVEVPGSAGGELPAALLDANALNTLLTGSYRETLPPFEQTVIVFLLSFVVALGSILLPVALSPVIPVAVGAAVWFGSLAASRSGTVVDMLTLYVVVVLTFAATLAWRAVHELLRRRRLVWLFSQYVPATVARQLIEPHRLRAMTDGQRVEVSILFCDLRGFTPMCARLEPAEVRVVLDRFYAAASEVILSRGGTVMHFNGDEVFGVFGAPLVQSDHASRAVDAAAALLDLRSETGELGTGDGLPPFGIGVNSGEVVAAHVGSDARRQYTVIGEPVNIAARLCSSAVGDEAVLSEATVFAADITGRISSRCNPCTSRESVVPWQPSDFDEVAGEGHGWKRSFISAVTMSAPVVPRSDRNRWSDRTKVANVRSTKGEGHPCCEFDSVLRSGWSRRLWQRLRASGHRPTCRRAHRRNRRRRPPPRPRWYRPRRRRARSSPFPRRQPPSRSRRPHPVPHRSSDAAPAAATSAVASSQTGGVRDWVVGGAVIEVRAWDGTGPDGPPDALLLVENRRANGTSDWTPPGGVIDEGESVVDGLTREVREETGLTVERWHGLLYEIEASAPGLGWNLRVEVHRAGAVLGPLRTGADPDGIVVGSAWAAGPRCVDLLGGTHPWVREPLLEWMAQRWDEPRRFRYRISGSGRDDLTVERW